MLEFSEKNIKKYYSKIKSLAFKSLYNNELENSLNLIETAARLAYSINWIYTDSELESMLSTISAKILPIGTINSPIKGRYVFYDYFASDNKCLTQQYIRALISWDIEFLYLLEGDDQKNSTRIMQELKMYPKVEIYALPNKYSKVEKIKKAYNKIADYRPEKIFMQLHPADVIAVSTLIAFPEVTKYQINLTDHAFWLGVNITDYSLEFRNYGCTVSIEKRGINKNKLLVQPFYPITDCDSFKGLPPEVTPEKTIIFSGGSYYKIYGEDSSYFHILKQLLDENPSVIIVYAGGGNEKPFRQFIIENNFNNRLFLIGNRTDINHIFSMCDIYLGTFPAAGGLMSQFAAINGKPILAYNKTNIPGNFIEDFLSNGEYGNKSLGYTDLDELMIYSKELINNKEFRENEGKIIKSRVIDPTIFSENLHELITSNTNKKKINLIGIDYNKFCETYIVAENKFNNSFPLFFARRFGLLSIILFPKAGIKFSIEICSNKVEFWKFIKTVFRNLMKKNM